MKSIFALLVLFALCVLFSCNVSTTSSVNNTHIPTTQDSIVVLSEPANNAVFPDSSVITFKWRNTLNASQYEIQIALDSSFPCPSGNFSIVQGRSGNRSKPAATSESRDCDRKGRALESITLLSRACTAT